MNKVLFSSQKMNWETPQELFDQLNELWHFQLDVAADADNAKCGKFYTQSDNGLAQAWAGINWCNPPYGRGIVDWCRKAAEESGHGKITVMLIPARTDTFYFHEYCKKHPITFLRGRLKFGGAQNSAPFPSMLVYFGAEPIDSRVYDFEKMWNTKQGATK